MMMYLFVFLIVLVVCSYLSAIEKSLDRVADELYKLRNTTHYTGRSEYGS